MSGLLSCRARRTVPSERGPVLATSADPALHRRRTTLALIDRWAQDFSGPSRVYVSNVVRDNSSPPEVPRRHLAWTLHGSTSGMPLPGRPDHPRGAREGDQRGAGPVEGVRRVPRVRRLGDTPAAGDLGALRSVPPSGVPEHPSPALVSTAPESAAPLTRPPCTRPQDGAPSAPCPRPPGTAPSSP